MCGLKHLGIQKRLLAESELSFARAVEIAQAMEAAEKGTQAVKEPVVAIQRIKQPKSYSHKSSQPSKTPTQLGTAGCRRCGDKSHTPGQCKFKEVVCFKCKKKGHIARVCRSEGRASQGKGRLHQVETTSELQSSHPGDDQGSSGEELGLFHVGGKTSSPICVELLLDGQQVTMELDTGAAVSIMSEEQCRRLFPKARLQATEMVLRTYTSERMEVAGELLVNVAYESQTMKLPLVIVK